MTTEELVRLIEQDNASHRRHDCAEVHPFMPGYTTIGSLYDLAGVNRRTIEEAIQTARLEGVPVLTDGGVRVAQTAEEAFGLYRWLRSRMVTQMKTAWAVRSQAMLMQRGEREWRAQAHPIELVEAPTLWGEAA